MGRFTEKNVLITGGAGGIGRAVAELFLRDGAAVCLAGRTQSKLDSAMHELHHCGDVCTACGDVSTEACCKQIIDKAVKKLGCIDVLVNSAGIYIEKPTNEFTEEEWNSIVDINLKGTFMMCKNIHSYLKETKGSIVNVSSTAGEMGFAKNTAYCATKAGIDIMTKALAVEYAKDEIRVNVVCPDMVDTAILTKDFENSEFETREEYDEFNWVTYAHGSVRGRYITPQEVAYAILFFADNEKAAPITGASLLVDFGLTAGM